MNGIGLREISCNYKTVETFSFFPFPLSSLGTPYCCIISSVILINRSTCGTGKFSVQLSRSRREKVRSTTMKDENDKKGIFISA